MVTQLSNDELIAEYQRLSKAGWDRALQIARAKAKRHEGIDFTNMLFTKQLTELEQEMKNRGLK